MTIRELLADLIGHAEDGRKLEDQVYVRVGKEFRTVESAYSDGTFILTAGAPLSR